MKFSRLRTRLAEIDAQIVELKRVLHQLQQTRSDVERDLYATSTYPVLTLPTEITREILIQVEVLGRNSIVVGVCRSQRRVNQDYADQPTEPTILGVCRSWRDIAFATPILWTKLYIDFGCIAVEIASEPGLVEGCIDRWLARAGNRPLSIDFDCDGDQPFAHSRLRDVIHRWSHRVQYLTLTIDRHDFFSLGLDSAAFHYSSVQRFMRTASSHTSILILPVLPLATPPAYTTFFCHRGNLVVITHRSLKSLTIEANSDGLLQYLILPGLQCLDGGNANSGIDDESLELLLTRSSPPLISLFIRGSHFRGNYHRLRRCTSHVARTLESLEVEQVSNRDIHDIFRLFDTLPNIRTLALKFIDGHSDLYSLVSCLYRRPEKLHAVAFRVLWRHTPFLDGMLWGGPPDTTEKFETISSHLSRLACLGVNIHVGTEDKNYALISDAPVEGDIV
ncbi:hypothetical protein DFH08DRAFT_983050 [Mycena albidolilacea]|uniref:F-box domain-containing protein n=1 Tax=Mycena albidolilacea TaxID=1033008 RepID=A0AAD7F734_9AGAR|nr:hypothetical protein DFH08DRAFT_983050 [Mycena albidolilacea]